MLVIKLVGYCTVSCLRRDIGGDYATIKFWNFILNDEGKC
jgi:hypothetical protein